MFAITDGESFPFSCNVSLDPLVTVWREYADDCPHTSFKIFADSILSDYNNHSDLQGRIDNPAILVGHQDLLQRLFSLVIAYDSQQRDLIAVMPPFTFVPFYQSDNYKKLIVAENIAGMNNVHTDPLNVWLRILHAYCVIFRDMYGYNLDLDFPVVHTLQNPETGIFRCYQLDLDTRFVQVKSVGALPRSIWQQSAVCCNQFLLPMSSSSLYLPPRLNSAALLSPEVSKSRNSKCFQRSKKTLLTATRSSPATVLMISG
jgi:hypothetical protein